MQLKIYTAGPISGMNGDEVIEYFLDVRDELETAGFEVLWPLTGKGMLRTELEFRSHGYDNLPLSSNHAIYSRDQWMVSQSDVVYANLMNSGDRVSIGTMMELAWASILGKHVVVAMPEENVHRHAFVLEAAHIVFNTHEDAMAYFNKLGRMEE